jgi:F-type H+-transporting ATPase subunit b
LKRSPRIRFAAPPVLAAWVLAAVFIAVPLWLSASGATAFAQAAVSPAPAASAEAATPESAKPEAAESAEEKQIEAMRHSGAVQAIARILHVSVETAARIFEDLNSGILIAVILIFLARALPKAFRARTAGIQQQLIEARTAAEEAQERLAAVEQRLSRLDGEIAAIVRQTEADTAQDEIRIKQALEEERQRIVESAEREIDAAGAAAQRQLKHFAAELAVERAIHRIRLTPETDRLLIEDFAQNLSAEAAKGGRN